MDGKEISLENGEKFTITSQIFLSRSERVSNDAEDTFNNLFVKNLPTSEFTEDELKKVFEPFGNLISVKLDQSKAFGFVAFEKCEDARTALAHFTKAYETDETGLYVAKCQKKEDRLRMLKKDTLKFMKDLARNNLYFKGFPTDGLTSIEDLSQELKTFFEKFGEVKSLKLMSRTINVDGESRE
jgi:RNA recognition motif-containing protein